MQFDITVLDKPNFFKDNFVTGGTCIDDYFRVGSDNYKPAQDLVRDLTKKYPSEVFYHHAHGNPFGNIWFVYHGGCVVYVAKEKPNRCIKCGWHFKEKLKDSKCRLCSINK
jgi:hypothetical protein